MAELPQFAPVSPQLGVFPAFCRPHQTTLVLKDDSSGWKLKTSYAISDTSKNTVLKCKGEAFWVTPIDILDASDNTLFRLRNAKGFHLNQVWEAVAPNDEHEVLFTVRASDTILKGSRILTTFTNAFDNQAVELVESHDSVWSDRHASIMWNDERVAQIEKKFIYNEGSHFWGKSGYMVSIAPGVDVALIVAVCIAMDNKRKEESSTTADGQ